MSDLELEQDAPPDEPAPEAEPDESDAEEAAEDEEAPSEPEPEPEPEQVVDEDRAKLAKGLSTRYETYKASQIKLLGDEAPEWIVCPLCTSSMAPGFVNVRDFGRVPEDIQANVNTYFGLAREQEYEQDPDTQACPKCKGKTKVKSGAIDGDFILRGCDTCAGYGFVPPPGTPAVIGAANGTPEQAIAQALAEVEKPERDNWGEPRILPDGTVNANYGKMPQFKTVHPIYGVTAQLSAEELVSG